jgi:sirohydrochlorin cobaltochelatase
MDGLILFSHGSLLCGAGVALREHAARLRARRRFPIVEIGYLNYERPTFAEAIERCATAGVRRAFVVPYFLVAGRFVTRDLPQQLSAAQRAHPTLQLYVAPPLGYSERIAESVVESARGALPKRFWNQRLREAASLCESDPDCPLYRAERCFQNGSPTVVEERTPHTPSEESGSSSALLIMAHGSPRASSNAPLWEVVSHLRTRGDYGMVGVGFLDCNEPNIPDAIDALIAQGACRIIAVPYFLHGGSHVAEDLPMLLSQAQDRHPNIPFLLGDYIGRSSLLTDLLEERAESVRSRTQ